MKWLVCLLLLITGCSTQSIFLENGEQHNLDRCNKIIKVEKNPSNPRFIEVFYRDTCR